jgi:hypothetical protein
MSFKIKTGLSPFNAALGRNISIPIQTPQIGKVFAVITTENTPTKELYEQQGKSDGIGTIFYLDYIGSKDTILNEVNLLDCSIAKPYNPHLQDYPLVGELVTLVDAPAPASQVALNITQKYYTGIINVWNNNQQNSLSNDSLGATFNENGEIRKLLAFEGDRIYQGRKGNGIRFGSTVKMTPMLNEWSNTGNNGDPITILVNGYITTDQKQITPNIEEINKELSSIYLTSTQRIPLIPDRNVNLNPITNPKIVSSYFGGSQLLFNSDRLVLNSKKDEVMIFAKTNVEINTNNTINLNAGERNHLNSPRNFIGTKSDGTLPDEPLLLGTQTINLLTDILEAVSNFGSEVSSVISAPAGSPLMDLNASGNKLSNTINNLMGKLNKIISKQNYTS